MQRALAFDRSPALSVAFRFFLNVPAFLMLSAVVLAWLGLSDTAYTRWNPAVLAVAHFLTLGVLASAMLGAMMQILPVATHIHVLQPRITSPVVHACLTLGTLALATGFITVNPTLHVVAVILLAAAFTFFICAVTGGLIRDRHQRSPGSGEILVAVRLALLALAITVGLGLFMAGLRGGLWSVGATQAGAWLHGLPDLHVTWGLAGWVGLLVAGISYQVIPIFQATEIYPRLMTDTLAPLVFLLLAVLTLSGAWQASPSLDATLPQLAAASGLALAYLIYAVTTGYLLWTRKRPAPEPTTWFWHAGMVSLLLASLLGATRVWLPTLAPSTMEMLLGTLLIPGFAVSAVNGMLYKIIPFLLWHNAQRRAPMALPFIPKVRQFISERDALRQFVAHACAVVLLAAACMVPILLLPAALALAVSAALLSINIARALRLYLNTCQRIARTLAELPQATAATRPGAQ